MSTSENQQLNTKTSFSNRAQPANIQLVNSQLQASSQYSATALPSSSSAKPFDIVEYFTENNNEISLYLKKYCEFYVQSEEKEQKILEEIDNFHYNLLEYQAFLIQKLKAYKNKIATFSKILVSPANSVNNSLNEGNKK
jgi:hypothetical protein